MSGAGRTDSGVHALGQVAHFDLAREAPTDTVRDAINFHLKPAPVSVIAAEVAAPTSMRASRRPDATTSTASSTGVRRWRSNAAAPGT